MTKTKLTILTAVTALTLASPAFAQSFDPEIGTGNVQPFGYQPFQDQGFPERRLYNYAPTYGMDRPQWSTSPSVRSGRGNIGR
jgi:hypothetical protein